MKFIIKNIIILMLFVLNSSIYAQNSTIKQQHKVKKSETLFSIANKYGVTVSEIININPEMNTKGYTLKKDDFIFIPNKKEVENKAQAQTNIIKKINNNEVNVGVLLPLHDKDGDGLRMLEYYRGILLACDRLKKDNISINIQAYNVAVDSDIRSFLTNSDFAKLDVIFGPLYTPMVKPLADFCDKNNIKLVIPFSITGNEPQNHNSVFQVYQSQDDIDKKIIKNFSKQFGAYNVVYIDCNSRQNDKANFVYNLKSYLNTTSFSQSYTSIDVNDLQFKNAFSIVKPNIVVINSSKSVELKNIFDKLDKVLSVSPNIKISLLGYNEWFLYTKVYANQFFKYDVYIPSTYFYNEQSTDTKWLESAYRKTFNKDMMFAIPRFALTGFDHACYFIGGLNKFGNDFVGNGSQYLYNPVQVPLLFEDYGIAKKNKTFMFVHYKTDQTIEEIKL